MARRVRIGEQRIYTIRISKLMKILETQPFDGFIGMYEGQDGLLTFHANKRFKRYIRMKEDPEIRWG